MPVSRACWLTRVRTRIRAQDRSTLGAVVLTQEDADEVEERHRDRNQTRRFRVKASGMPVNNWFSRRGFRVSLEESCAGSRWWR